MDDLGKELKSDEVIRTLHERIDGLELDMDIAIESAMEGMQEVHDEQMEDFNRDRDELEERLLQRGTELIEATDRVKRRDKTIGEHEKTIRKLTVKQKKAEGFVCSAVIYYLQSY